MQPTSYPAINHLLAEILARARALLGDQFVSMYLEGSLVTGAFDDDSDIDFVIVTQADLSEADFVALRDMHAQISPLDARWGIQLEGSYLARAGVRRYDPAHTRFPNIQRGPGERLKWVDLGAWWTIHRWLLREHGRTLAGPPPTALIDPVTPEDLRQAMRAQLRDWAAPLLAQLQAPDAAQTFATRGYPSYIVLTLCRVLYTLQNATVVSKPAAAQWARDAYGPPWDALIARAWEGRHHADEPISTTERAETLAWLRLVLEANPLTD